MSLSVAEQHYQLLQHLDKAIKLELIAKLQADVFQKPLNDLSQLVPHHHVVNGDAEALVHINWEEELHLELPK